MLVSGYAKWEVPSASNTESVESASNLPITGRATRTASSLPQHPGSWTTDEYAKLNLAFNFLAFSEEGGVASSVSSGGCPNVAAIAMLFRGGQWVAFECAKNIKVCPYHDHAEAVALRKLSRKLNSHTLEVSASQTLTLVVVNVYTAAMRGSWCGPCVCQLLSFLDEHKYIKYEDVILAWPTMESEGPGGEYVTPTRALAVGFLRLAWSV